MLLPRLWWLLFCIFFSNLYDCLIYDWLTDDLFFFLCILLCKKRIVLSLCVCVKQCMYVFGHTAQTNTQFFFLCGMCLFSTTIINNNQRPSSSFEIQKQKWKNWKKVQKKNWGQQFLSSLSSSVSFFLFLIYKFEIKIFFFFCILIHQPHWHTQKNVFEKKNWG